MKFLKISSVLCVFALLLAVGCQKETQITDLSNPTSTFTSSERSEGETAALEAHVESIKAFRDAVHQWRENPSGEAMPAIDAVEKTEIAFNLFLGQPTKAFESYEWVERDISVNASQSWKPAEIADFYDAVKAMVVEQLDGENRQLYIISLGNPVETDNGSSVKVNLHIGVNPLDAVGEYKFHDGTRWTVAPEGFTDPTPCDGAANFDIGAAANQQIGVYNAINAGPISGGNTPLPGKSVSRIVFGDHSLFGFPFPQGANFPQVYNTGTFGTPLQSLHYNDIAINGVPDWNCLTNAELIGFGFGNLGLADNGKQFVAPVQIGSFSFPRRVVCTGVGSFFGGANTPGLNPINVKFQDHPTRHYFGVVSQVVIVYIPVDDM